MFYGFGIVFISGECHSFLAGYGKGWNRDRVLLLFAQDGGFHGLVLPFVQVAVKPGKFQPFQPGSAAVRFCAFFRASILGLPASDGSGFAGYAGLAGNLAGSGCC